MRFLVPTLVLVAALAAACGGDNGNPSGPSTPSAPFSTTDIRVGTGAEATSGKRIAVNYSGWLYSATASENKGTMFDTSIGRGAYILTLGAGEVIKGWDQGIVGMRVGGVRRIVVPPELGYGSKGNGPIPANATLVFDVELLAMQ
jgi:FKBP-type peptidyl-prolyl cis-trans isomerase